MKERVKCFEDVIDRKKSYALLDGGLRVVEVKRIVGTVDKCDELDGNFHNLRRRDRQEINRRNSMADALRRYEFLPPIELYLLRGEYYVVDGNRRVAAAKDMKIDFIDAHVTEYVSRENFVDMSGSLSRRRFETQTGIKSITLTHENGYEALLEEVMQYPADGGVIKKGRKWYSEIFLRACKRIERTSLPGHYREIQTGDIYVLINRFYRNYLGGVPHYTDYDTIISGFMFAHGIRQRRPLRFPLLNLLSALFLRRGGRDGG